MLKVGSHISYPNIILNSAKTLCIVSACACEYEYIVDLDKTDVYNTLPL